MVSKQITITPPFLDVPELFPTTNDPLCPALDCRSATIDSFRKMFSFDETKHKTWSTAGSGGCFGGCDLVLVI